jgi:hypothetical protein
MGNCPCIKKQIFFCEVTIDNNLKINSKKMISSKNLKVKKNEISSKYLFLKNKNCTNISLLSIGYSTIDNFGTNVIDKNISLIKDDCSSENSFEKKKSRNLNKTLKENLEIQKKDFLSYESSQDRKLKSKKLCHRPILSKLYQRSKKK